MDETVREKDIDDLLNVFGVKTTAEKVSQKKDLLSDSLEKSAWNRTSNYLSQAVFNSHHSETRIMRYMKSLENKDISLVHSMIALVSRIFQLFKKFHPLVDILSPMVIYPLYRARAR